MAEWLPEVAHPTVYERLFRERMRRGWSAEDALCVAKNVYPPHRRRRPRAASRAERRIHLLYWQFDEG